MYLLSTYPKGVYIQEKTISSMHKYSNEKIFVKLSDDAWDKYNKDESLKEKYRNGFSRGW